MVPITNLTGRLGNQMFQYAFIYSQFRDGVIPDLYIQDYRYFDKYQEEVRTVFGEGIGYLPYVAIHLRVGGNPLNASEPNYIDNPFYVSLPKTGYYIDAINLFPNRKFLVFSDDIAFAKTYFEGDKFAFDESDNEIDSFNQLSSCDGHIIANSSWSWWGAYLSPNRGKVVAPSVSNWYTDGVERTTCPKDWIRV